MQKYMLQQHGVNVDQPDCCISQSGCSYITL